MNVAQVPDEGPTQLEFVWPLTICRDGFYVGGSSWFRHREKFPDALLADFIDLRYSRVVTADKKIKSFFAGLDPLTVASRRRCSKSVCHGATDFVLLEPKDEPAEEEDVCKGDRRYSFFFRPS